MKSYYQQDSFKLTADRVSEERHPIFGDIVTWHNVVIASEIVQPYNDGRAWKPRDELEKYAPYVDGRWVIVGGHPEDGIISDTEQIAGRTINPRYVKDLMDPKTHRPNRAGVRADVQIFKNKVPPKLLEDMISGKKQDVSIGFFFTKDPTAGVVETDSCKGEEYDYVQRNMFHDHLAAGIDNGRCPMPYCGLGADEVKQNLTGDPFAGFEGFNDCVSKIMAKNKGMSEESAKKICGKLKSEHEDTKVEDDAMRKTLRELAQMILDEMEELKGMKDAQKEKTEQPWYAKIPWREEPYLTIYDCLEEDVRQLITEMGGCPHCDEDEEKKECEEGYEMNDKGECVEKKMGEEDVKMSNPGFTPGMAEHECPEGMEWNAEKKTCVEVMKIASKKKDSLDPHEVLDRFRRIAI